MQGLELLIRATRNAIVYAIVDKCLKALDVKVIKGGTLARFSFRLPSELASVNDDVQIVLEREGINLTYYIKDEDEENNVHTFTYRVHVNKAARYAATSGNQVEVIDEKVVTTPLGEMLTTFNRLHYQCNRVERLNDMEVN